ncbi:AAA family ATPase [Roseateles violae]|uniref:AAA family ATPase n=1 Tax=Roseateles violae TaxID=3058042 RepID=A0ABT8DTJ6_9BURK|nr:AAA family ATPase [Pelomonas sp. PFR6]MDN3921428.1 AAA family ATPase [Pelomonas sp. PFR6]
MYAKFFGLQQEPFAIAPDPRYLFMSERHRDALAHLLYGLQGGGGFVLLTGEIGAGKTTVCRCFLEQVPENCNVAYVFNPKLTVHELLQTICDEFHVVLPPAPPGGDTVKRFLDPLNAFLLQSHAAGRNNVLIIDEAQNLSAEVLEQLRLLTNLETSERKLLQIVLIGQPELRQMLARPELEQLAQRVIARFHLPALSLAETAHYVRHRLEIAGAEGSLPFDRGAMRRIHRLSRGVPRRINLLCDRALLGAYSRGRRQVDPATLSQAAAEVFDEAPRPALGSPRAWAFGTAGLLAAAAVAALGLRSLDGGRPAAAPPAPLLAVAASQPTATVASSAAAAPPPTAPLAEPETITTIALALPDEAAAWRELASLWQLPELGAGEPCAQLARRQLQCFRSDDGLALLRLLGRPAILRLQEASGAGAYVLLLGLGERDAIVRAGGREQRIALLALGRQWRGEFATLWRAPPGAQMGKGLDEPGLQWLDRQLDKAAEPAAERSTRIAAFQRAQGLRSDGVAGPITLMQLNRAVGIDEPRLRPLADEIAAAAPQR